MEQRDTYVCCPAKGTLLTVVCTVLLLLEWTWQDGPSHLWTWQRARDAGPEPPPEACSGSHMTAIQYLSVYVDNQRINDSCFFYSVVCSENRNMPTCPRGLILYKLLRAGYSGKCERRPGSEAWPLPVQPQARYLTSGTLGLSSV